MGFYIPDPRWDDPALLIPGRKPVGRFVVDKSHPLTPTHAWMYLGDGLNRVPDIIEKDAGADAVRQNLIATSFDYVANHFSLNGSSSFAWTRDTALQPVPPFTVVVKARGTLGSTDALWSASYTTLSNHQHCILLDTAGYLTVRSRAGSFATATAVNTVAANEWFTVCGVWGATNSRKLYLNGGFEAENTTTVSPTLPNRTDVGRLGDSTLSSYYEGDIEYVMYFDRALTDAQVADISRNPYQYLIPA